MSDGNFYHYMYKESDCILMRSIEFLHLISFNAYLDAQLLALPSDVVEGTPVGKNELIPPARDVPFI